MRGVFSLLGLLIILPHVLAFVKTCADTTSAPALHRSRIPTKLRERIDEGLGKKFGGYTVKQRLREEVESPFRTVRLFFFGSSTASALIALYFSTLSAFKASTMGDVYPDVDLQDALQSCGINVAATLICGFLTYRDWMAGNSNLKRIAKGGELARLAVESSTGVSRLVEYRRSSRVVIAAGGKEYIETVCRSLCSDQLQDANTFVEGLEASDVILVPVYLESETTVGNSAKIWGETKPDEDGRNFDPKRAQSIVAFPRFASNWMDYLESEIETCKSQGYDVERTGFTITVKKNGKILRRATGQPPFSTLISTMEVLDGSKFGMPGDDEKYGS